MVRSPPLRRCCSPPRRCSSRRWPEAAAPRCACFTWQPQQHSFNRAALCNRAARCPPERRRCRCKSLDMPSLRRKTAAEVLGSAQLVEQVNQSFPHYYEGYDREARARRIPFRVPSLLRTTALPLLCAWA